MTSLRRLVCTWFFLSFGIASAQPAPATDPYAQAVQGAQRLVERMFAISPGVMLEPELREWARETAAEHLARTQEQLVAWVAEELSAEGQPVSEAAMSLRLGNRVINEAAQWRLERVDRGYEEALAAALRKPGFCGRFRGATYFTEVLLFLQSVPRNQQGALLSAERELLRRWGSPREQLIPPPLRPPLEAALRELRVAKEGALRPSVVLPPALAASTVAAAQEQPWDRGSECALHQWVFWSDMARHAPLSAALDKFRYAMAPNAAGWFDGPRLPGQPDFGGAAADDYPRVAAQRHVEGVVAMEAWVDADARVQQAAVVRRKLTVPGLRNVRPAAFETLFDEASLARASRAALSRPSGERPVTGRVKTQFDVRWSLR